MCYKVWGPSYYYRAYLYTIQALCVMYRVYVSGLGFTLLRDEGKKDKADE